MNKYKKIIFILKYYFLYITINKIHFLWYNYVISYQVESVGGAEFEVADFCSDYKCMGLLLKHVAIITEYGRDFGICCRAYYRCTFDGSGRSNISGHHNILSSCPLDTDW